MQPQSIIPNVRDARATIRENKQGERYVIAHSVRYYAPKSARCRKGFKVLIRFDVPGSGEVSVWTLGDTLIGMFKRA